MQIAVTIRGTRPISFARDISDKLHPDAKELAAVMNSMGRSSKRTIADEEHLERLRYMYAFYMKDGKMYIPDRNIRQTFIEGTKTGIKNSGKIREAVAAGLFVTDGVLEYDESLTPEKMYENPKYVLRRGIQTSTGQRNVKIDPMLPEWGLRFGVQLEESLVDEAQAKTVLTLAGRLKGIGANRRALGFGRFVVERWEREQ